MTLHKASTAVGHVLVLLVVLAAPRGAAGQPIVETLPDDYSGFGVQMLTGVHILVQPVQPTLLGPDALRKDLKAPGLGALLFSETIDPLIGGAGAAFDIAAGLNDLGTYQSADPDALDRRPSGFDFHDETMTALAALDDGADWVASAIEEHEFIRDMDGSWRSGFIAGDILRDGFSGAVMALRLTYFVSPDLRQVRLRAELRTYGTSTRKSGAREVLHRHYEYLGPKNDVVLRPWHDGEKEDLIREIEDTYTASVERQPHNEAAYRQDRDRALNLIVDRDTILPSRAMREGWPDDKLTNELRTALHAVVHMIATDRKALWKKHEGKGTRSRFQALSPAGKPAGFSGRALYSLGSNTVYATRNGDLYSVPTAN